ncbi:hypothetical protein DU500_12190 [Haloplanus rubicundus]|uniref:Uncharacterized protein n=1 Tax=Haloplanus rubicundus TaxID=1547898 RepID=A0A345E4K1_9EURY|nr:hypothetical protein [Haloplanus rubicundus]AXG07123.1 hypothetical protein DU500_12190 [Haloplanus rubicundus]
MTPTDSDTGGRVVTWTAFPDRDADRFRLVVLHLAAGVPVVIGLAVLVLLVFIIANGLTVENAGGTVLVVVLALIGGPASLVYLLLAVKYGSEREVQKLTPSLGWFRLRYIPVSLLGGGILLLSVAIQPGMLLVYLIGLVVCKMAVDLRYTVGRIDPETAILRQVSGAVAAEYTDDIGLDTSDRRVRTFDLSTLRCVYQRQIGDYTVFIPRYQSRGRWGRPLVLVIPNDTATEAKTALDTVIRTTDWAPDGGLDRAVRIVLGGLGVLFLGTAGVFATVGADALPVVAYAAATLGLLGVIMLFLSIRG